MNDEVNLLVSSVIYEFNIFSIFSYRFSQLELRIQITFSGMF